MVLSPRPRLRHPLAVAACGRVDGQLGISDVLYTDVPDALADVKCRPGVYEFGWNEDW